MAKKKPTHGGPRKGAGRPPKGAEARSVPLPVKVSPTEIDALRTRAEKLGVTLADLVRTALALD